jgi:hypothetical protein
VIRLAAGYDDSLSKASEGGQSVGAALDELDLVDDALGVAVGGGLIEVGQQLFAPGSEPVGEGGEGGDLGALDDDAVGANGRAVAGWRERAGFERPGCIAGRSGG